MTILRWLSPEEKLTKKQWRVVSRKPRNIGTIVGLTRVAVPEVVIYTDIRRIVIDSRIDEIGEASSLQLMAHVYQSDDSLRRRAAA